ncbi:MAG: hypothetical protein QM527_13995 [Alphaproteobacteria bacterium]|nr:hypothetical protein [Alphaproteobacteria bacterium]
MDKHPETLISPEEWRALMGPSQRGRVDVYYPLRVWFLIATCAIYAVGLIFSSHHLAHLLASDPTLVDRLSVYLLFRGWFVVFATILGLWAYARGWRLRPIFWGLFLISGVNLSSDLFIVYPERLANPTWGFTALFTLRLLAIVALYFCARNLHRNPAPQQRFDLFFPLRHTAWFNRRSS